MVKFKTTQREIKDGYWKVISVGYCELQNLLEYENPIAYTCGKDGWHSDIYDIDGRIAISTGYAPFGEIEPSYDVCRKYEFKAESVLHDTECHWSYEEKKKILKKLINDFVEEVLETEK